MGSQLQIAYAIALTSQLISKMAHGGEKERDARFVRPDAGCLARYLISHPQPIAFGIEALESTATTVQLVAEDDDQVSATQASYLLRRRQAREQKTRVLSATTPSLQPAEHRLSGGASLGRKATFTWG